MILLSGSELIATIGFLRDSVRQGDSFWKVLWKGKKVDPYLAETRPKRRSKAGSAWADGAWGFTLPWNLVLLALFGAYLMFSPYLFDIKGDLAVAEYILGPLLITFSVISMVEVYRIARFVNILFGIALIIVSFLCPSFVPAANWNAAAVGLLALALAWPKGLVRERYGSWDRLIF